MYTLLRNSSENPGTRETSATNGRADYSLFNERAGGGCGFTENCCWFIRAWSADKRVRDNRDNINN